MREDPIVRKEQILETAVGLAEYSHYNNITRDEIAAAVGISPGLINYYFTSIEALRHEVLERACGTKRLIIIAQAIVDNNPFVFALTTPSLREKALKAIADDTGSL